MRDGADVIFQATFFDGRWRGHADFLFKRPDRASPVLGSWSYDIADETQHVRFGNKWVPVLIAKCGDPRSFEQVKADARNSHLSSKNRRIAKSRILSGLI